MFGTVCSISPQDAVAMLEFIFNPEFTEYAEPKYTSIIRDNQSAFDFYSSQKYRHTRNDFDMLITAWRGELIKVERLINITNY